MKITRKSWLCRFAWKLSVATGLTLAFTAEIRAQSSVYDAQTGSARISGGSPTADYRVDPAQYAAPPAAYGGHAQYQGLSPNSVYGGGYMPPQGTVVDPTFRAAAGLGGPSLQELDRIRLQVLHSNGDIYGTPTAYTNIGAFIPRRVFSDYNLFAINPRIMLDNNGDFGANLGAIHRFYLPEYDRMFGSSLWWDFSQSYTNSVNGVGYSFETVGRYLSIRANTTWRMGNSQRIYNSQILDPTLFGNYIALPVVESFQAPLNHHLIEASVPAPYLGKYGLELGVGGYLLTGTGVKDTFGVRGRAQWQITEDLWFNTIVSNDDLFDTNVQFNVEYRMPGGIVPSRIARPNPVVMSLVQSVQRDYQFKVANGQRVRYYNEINPKDGQPLRVANINPNAGTSGDGSVANPYASLADYMAADPATRAQYDFILVQARNDGTAANLNTGITLTDTQHLIGLGASASGTLPTYTSSRGTFFLPGDYTGELPMLSNAGFSGGNVVTLAGNATEVANLAINGTNTGSGIVSAGFIDGFNIHDNTIVNVIDGVRISSNTAALLNCPGEDIGIVRNNIINGTSGVGNDGVNINHTGGRLDLLVADNTLDPFDRYGISVSSNGAGAVVNAVGAGVIPEYGILRNNADQMGTGISLRATAGGQLLADVQDNVVTRSTNRNGAGLEVVASGSGSTVVLNTLSDNQFTTGQGNGASLSVTGGGAILSPNAWTNNSFGSNAGDGVNAFILGAGSAIELQGIGDGTVAGLNNFSNNGDDGFDVSAIAGGKFTVINPIVGNSFSSNGDNGFVALANGLGSQLNFDLGDPNGLLLANTFNNNGGVTLSGNGASIRLVNSGVFNGGVYNNQFVDNFGSGVSIAISNGSQGPLIIQGNSAFANGNSGIRVVGMNATFSNVDILNNVSDGSQAGDGFTFMATNSPVTGRLRITGNGFRNNAGDGVGIILDNSPIAQLEIFNNVGGTVIAPGTIDFTYTSDGVAPSLTGILFGTRLPDHSMTNNSTAGIDIVQVRVLTSGSGQVWRPDLPVPTVFSPAAVAEPFQPQNATDVTTGLTTVNGTAIIAGTSPLQNSTGTALPFGGVAIGSNQLSLGFDSFNPGDQFVFQLAHAANQNTTATGLGSAIAGSTVELTLADGQVVTGTMVVAPGVNNQATVNINQVISGTGIGITNNGGSGVFVNARNGSHLDNVRIAGNIIDGNQQNGIEIRARNSRLPGQPNEMLIGNNVITNQVSGFGISVTSDGATNTPIDARLVNNTITGNGGGGVNFDIGGATDFRLVAGTNTIDNNGGPGLNVIGRDNANIFLKIGDPNEPDVNANSFNNNTDVGIGLTLFDDAFGRLVVRNTTVSGTIDGNTAGSFFNGDGIGVAARDRSQFIGAVLNSQLLNNDGAGIFASATGNNLTEFSTIHYFDIGGPDPADGNLIEGNGNGIQFLRTSNGRIGSTFPVNIQNNIIRSNLLDGIFLSSQQSNTFDFYTIQDNLITLNGANGVQGLNGGIHLDAQADAQLRADIFRNMVTNNSQDGILVTDDSNFPSDQRAVGGSWFNNEITNNGGNGINLSGSVFDLFIGSEFDQTTGNLISRNGIDGIQNDSAGSWTAAQNLISLNGTHGVDIEGVGYKDIRLVHNHITQNGTAAGEPGDGIEFNNSGAGGTVFQVTALGNVVDFNEGRGFDILNQGRNAYSFITIDTDAVSGQNSVFNGNGGEGIYVVNTSSTTQDQSSTTPSQGIASSTNQPVGTTHKGMNTDGNVFSYAFLNIDINDALVVANGQNNAVTDFQATGIVFRVGTTGGGYGFTSSGAFASDQFYGGVVASLTNTSMGGNFGDDLFFESFTSTADPATTAGAWDQNTFNVTNYVGDPLARLDLTYRNNTYIEAPTGINPPTNVTTQGAYYDNAEGVFKSRLNNIQAPNLAGPFANASRRRNAQRQALRVYGDGTILNPQVGPGLNFLYPGMGDSTFRIDTANSDPLLTLLQTGFIIDSTSPLFGQFDANGVYYPIGGNTQDFRSPWGWGTF
ncbi:MAG: beta strand repeat-containing protein [Planctomycetaceae bacterium]